MVSSFDEKILSEMLKYEYINNNDNYNEILSSELSSIISNNSCSENQEIIYYYVGDIYDALKIFNKLFKPIDINNYENKEYFYADLAFASLYNYFNDINNDIDE